MEQSEHYQRAISFSAQLDQQLNRCDEVYLLLAKGSAIAIKEINEHFDLCMSLLQARRSALTTALIHQAKNHLVATKAILQQSKESCGEILNVAPIVYKHDQLQAEKMWKEAVRFSCPLISLADVSTSFNHSLLTAIEQHGRFSIGTKEHSSAAPLLIAGKVTTLAGSVVGYTDGNGDSSKFNCPRGLCFNPHDQCVYVCDSKNNAIRKVTMQGTVTTFVPNGPKLSRPTGIVMNYKENVFLVINKGNHTITKISSSGVPKVFAGNGYPGNTNGTGINASFNNPKGITIDQQTGNLFISDFNNSSIRKVTPQGEVSTIIGSQTNFVSALFSSKAPIYPRGIAFDATDQSLFVCDFFNNEFIRVSLKGDISSVYKIYRPTSVVLTESRNIIVSSTDNCIYQIIKQGSRKYEMIKIAGNGKNDSVDGKSISCSFGGASSLAFCEHPSICFVAEYDGCKIREINFER